MSRKLVEQKGRELRQLTERRFDGREFLVIYLDGVVFGDYHVLCAVGVDSEGKKVVLGMKDGDSENGPTAVALLESLVERGIDPARRHPFIPLDGRGPTSHLKVIQELGRRGDSRYHQVVPGTGAGDVEQVSLRVVDLLEIRIISDGFHPLL